MNVRIIPRLDIKGPNLVKGIHLEGLRVLGKPFRFADYYYRKGADELIYMDVVASLYGRNSLLDIIRETSERIFIPLTVGGGLRSIEDIRKVLHAGADKVSLNTAIIAQPELIRKAAEHFGSSTIVVSIEAKEQPDGSFLCYTDNGRVRTSVDVFSWAEKVAELGAGEILLTSIDREGTGKGFDLNLTRRIARSVPIPVIACGGAGSVEDVVSVIREGESDAVCLSSCLHYHYIRHNYTEDDFSTEGNVEFLRSGRAFTKVHKATLPAVRDALRRAGVVCREVPDVE